MVAELSESTVNISTRMYSNSVCVCVRVRLCLCVRESEHVYQIGRYVCDVTKSFIHHGMLMCRCAHLHVRFLVFLSSSELRLDFIVTHSSIMTIYQLTDGRICTRL